MARKKKKEEMDYYGGDGPERIDQCLTCDRKTCNNCLARVPNPEGRKKKRSYWAVQRNSGSKSQVGP